MTKKTIAGIRRGNQFSPNHIGNDAAIFSLTAKRLEAYGCKVNEYIESDLLIKELEEPFFFNMVRDWNSIRKLQQLEDRGRLVINSGYGIENCTRERMTRLLVEQGIAHPVSLIVSTHEDPAEKMEAAGITNAWVKRGDFHAVHREDVTYVRNRDEAYSILKEFAIRNIPSAVINEHLTGDLVKFYGVKGTDFFYWFYPSSNHHSKFGWEVINGTAEGIPFDKQELQTLCNKAADILNVCIYGGDCIVSRERGIQLIDFNDWPSFAPCRDEAAKYIAECIWQYIK